MVTIVISFITALLTLGYAGIVLYLRQGWINLQVFQPSVKSLPKIRVSVIIAARNEEDKLDKTINDLLNQDYPKELFEIIVVDDHSTDRTSEIISSYSEQGVLLIKLNEHKPLNSYKKKAIAEAIQISKGELIITTDADCRMGLQWLKTIVDYYQQTGCKMISSPVVFFEEKNTFEKMQTLEFLYLIGLGAATIGQNIPSTCNGANLAYRKDVFNEVDGFRGIDDLASGDDELLLHKIASLYPTKIGFCKSEKALVYTHAKPDISAFIQQRKRWASKSTKYKNKGIVALGISLWIFNLFILINIVIGLFDAHYIYLAGLSFFIKILVEVAFLNLMCGFVKRKNLMRYQPLLSFAHIFYFVYIGLAGNSGKYLWKGRMVR
ncbi:MAG: glycosyltransferase [Flavobacterium sp.]|nr:glycosyltransferase [Pedobacter sp.]